MFDLGELECRLPLVARQVITDKAFYLLNMKCEFVRAFLYFHFFFLVLRF